MARYDKRVADQMQAWADYKPATREELIKYWQIATDPNPNRGLVECRRRNFEHTKKILEAQGWVWTWHEKERYWGWVKKQ